MGDDDLDLSEFGEHSRSTAGARSRSSKGDGGRPRRWPWLLAGLILGALGALFLPDLASPYLPSILRTRAVEVRGPVLAKRLEGDRLLLTVNTERGAMLATFHRRVAEIDLLVSESDTVTLGLQAYAPLVEDPSLAAVTKAGSDLRGGSPDEGPDSGVGAEPGGPGEVREDTASDAADPEDVPVEPQDRPVEPGDDGPEPGGSAGSPDGSPEPGSGM